ncbi:hypothetical protein HG530_002977 [Fusarium avenaceum]|nr:hypothetical protein HG530_002977 [Fusarium avenaceum]
MRGGSRGDIDLEVFVPCGVQCLLLHLGLVNLLVIKLKLAVRITLAIAISRRASVLALELQNCRIQIKPYQTLLERLQRIARERGHEIVLVITLLASPKRQAREVKLTDEAVANLLKLVVLATSS